MTAAADSTPAIPTTIIVSTRLNPDSDFRRGHRCFMPSGSGKRRTQTPLSCVQLLDVAFKRLDGIRASGTEGVICSKTERRTTKTESHVGERDRCAHRRDGESRHAQPDEDVRTISTSSN